jgi:hypothetical protein
MTDALKGLSRWHKKTKHGPHAKDDLASKLEESEYLAPIKQAFAEYLKWWQKQSNNRKVRRSPVWSEINKGLMPGDFSATYTKPFENDNNKELKIGIVGLNSAFLQLTKLWPDKQLVVMPEQFVKVCEGNAEWIDERHLCLLMMHHPPEWLAGPDKEIFERDIFNPVHFAALYCGHQHESLTTRQALRGKNERVQLIGSALYGLEHVGKAGDGKIRIHGYSGMRYEFRGEAATVKQWSRIACKELDWEFIDDPGLSIDPKYRCNCAEPFSVAHAFRPNA